MQRKTSTKTKETAYKGSVKQYIATKQKGYKRGDVAIYTRNLIRQVADGTLDLKDFQIANKVKAKFGGMTSVKSIQWYRHQMRKEGLIANYPPRKARKYITETMYEVINKDLNIDIQVLSAKKLIVFAKKEAKLLDRKNLIIYSINDALNYLFEIGYEINIQD